MFLWLEAQGVHRPEPNIDQALACLSVFLSGCQILLSNPAAREC